MLILLTTALCFWIKHGGHPKPKMAEVHCSMELSGTETTVSPHLRSGNFGSNRWNVSFPMTPCSMINDKFYPFEVDLMDSILFFIYADYVISRVWELYVQPIRAPRHMKSCCLMPVVGSCLANLSATPHNSELQKSNSNELYQRIEWSVQIYRNFFKLKLYRYLPLKFLFPVFNKLGTSYSLS